MLRSAVPLLLFAAVACTRAEPPLLIDGGEQSERSSHAQVVPVAVKAAIRADAQQRHGTACGAVTLPDDAFVPIEITGRGDTDYAVIFQDASCPRNATNWQNTSGTLTQFWTVSGQQPRMLLEQHSYGFTPRRTGFQSLQHQNDCGPASLSLCVVSYRWDAAEQALKIVERRNLVPRSRMQWDYRNPQ